MEKEKLNSCKQYGQYMYYIHNELTLRISILRMILITITDVFPLR